MPTNSKRSRNYSSFQTSIKDCLSAAECYKSTSADIAEQIRSLRNRYNLPGYCWQWAEGYEQCRRDAWYRYNLVHCYVIDGQIVVGKWDSMTEPQREVCRRGENVIGGFWWKDKDGQPIANRPYFVSRDNRLPKDPITGHYPLSEDVTEQFK